MFSEGLVRFSFILIIKNEYFLLLYFELFDYKLFRHQKDVKGQVFRFIKQYDGGGGFF